jgi:hypothetical protein
MVFSAAENMAASSVTPTAPLVSAISYIRFRLSRAIIYNLQNIYIDYPQTPEFYTKSQPKSIGN